VPVRPFTVLGVQQIALGARRRAELQQLWVDCFGLTHTGFFRSAAENVDEEILSLGLGLGRVEVDLMEPIDENARPTLHEPALHHVGLWIDELRAAVAWLVGRGVRFTPGGIRRGAAGHDICFVHPKPSRFFPLSGQGVLIELVQAPALVIEAYRALAGAADPPESAPAPVQPPVTQSP
jgi:lactoylglutathione lyase